MYTSQSALMGTRYSVSKTYETAQTSSRHQLLLTMKIGIASKYIPNYADIFPGLEIPNLHHLAPGGFTYQRSCFICGSV